MFSRDIHSRADAGGGAALGLAGGHACAWAGLFAGFLVMSGCASSEEGASTDDTAEGGEVSNPESSTTPSGSVAPQRPVGSPAEPGVVIVDGPEPEGTSPAAGMGTECARETYEAERTDVNLYLLLDVSGSMLATIDADGQVTQWQAVREAVKGFIESPEAEGFNLAMNYYPIQSERSLCGTRDRCPGETFCVNAVCDLRLALLDFPVPCQDSNECLVFQDADGSLIAETCVRPWHCSYDETQLCLLDEQCPGGTCVQEPVAICPGATSCQVEDYVAPLVERTRLPMQRQAFIDALDAREPDSFALTPTQVALGGAYAHVQEWIDTDPGARSVVVLATDGAPLGCNDGLTEQEAEDLATGATFQAIEQARATGISTFVIGVVPDSTGLDPQDEAQAAALARLAALEEKLSIMAESGGTEASFNVTVDDTTTAAFLDALTAIADQVLPCEYEVPALTTGQVMFDRLNVQLTAQGESAVTIPKVDSAADCVEGEQAWHYNVSEAEQTPTRVQLCPSTCESVNAEAGGRVDIVLGCQTLVRVR